MTDSKSRICLLLIVAMMAGACSARRGSIAAWRLVPASATTSLLVPPGVKSAGLEYNALKLARAPHSKSCAESDAGLVVQSDRRHLTVGVHSGAFANRAPGWRLNAWVSRLADQGCFDATDSPSIATAITELLPLEENLAFRLLYSDVNWSETVDLTGGVRLQVTSPILREGALPGAALVTGNDKSLEVTLSAPDMAGYEVSLYALKKLEAHGGLDIVPLSGERHLEGGIQQAPVSTLTLFNFESGLTYYRLLRKSESTSFSAFVLAGKTVAQIEEMSRRIEAGSAPCQEARRYCVAIPKAVAINVLAPVLVNGREQLVRWGANVAEVIRQNGEPRPDTVLSSLEVYKPHDGAPARVGFNPANRAILDLVLAGNESLRWNKR